MVDNGYLRDERLSWKAKGLLTYLLSLPADWKPRQEHLVTVSADKDTSVASAIKELTKYGYMRMCRKQDEQGRWTSERYVYETPLSDDPMAGITDDQETQVSENLGALLNTKDQELTTKDIEVNMNQEVDIEDIYTETVTSDTQEESGQDTSWLLKLSDPQLMWFEPLKKSYGSYLKLPTMNLGYFQKQNMIADLTLFLESLGYKRSSEEWDKLCLRIIQDRVPLEALKQFMEEN